jgi:hypothetical protein
LAKKAVGYSAHMRAEKQEVALLRILIGCGEKAIEAFQASDNPVDEEFLTDLERVVARSRDELAALTEKP